MKCNVCGKWFTPVKDNTYLVSDHVTKSVYDALDCPRCGCQHQLKLRMPKFTPKPVKRGVRR